MSALASPPEPSPPPAPEAATPSTTPSSSLSDPSSAAHHATEMVTLGYTVVPSLFSASYLSTSLFPAAVSTFSSSFDRLIDNLHIPVQARASLPGAPLPDGTYPLGHGALHGYSEIVRRGVGRYEQRYGVDSPPFVTTSDDPDGVQNNLLLLSILSQTFSNKPYKLLGSSIVTSLPSSSDQSWHIDGPHLSKSTHLPIHCLNVFIPLVDVPAEMGPTEVKPASHLYTRDTFKLLLGARARGEVLPNHLPELSLGDILIFDYRILHRGRANLSLMKNRPVLVLTYAEEWFNDLYNFPPDRSLETVAKRVEVFVYNGVNNVSDGSDIISRDTVTKTLDFIHPTAETVLVYTTTVKSGVHSGMMGGISELIDLKKRYPTRVVFVIHVSDLMTLASSLASPTSPKPPVSLTNGVLEYLKLSVLMYVSDDTLVCSDGVDAGNVGVVPGVEGRVEDVREWCVGVNGWKDRVLSEMLLHEGLEGGGEMTVDIAEYSGGSMLNGSHELAYPDNTVLEYFRGNRIDRVITCKDYVGEVVGCVRCKPFKKGGEGSSVLFLLGNCDSGGRVSVGEKWCYVMSGSEKGREGDEGDRYKVEYCVFNCEKNNDHGVAGMVGKQVGCVNSKNSEGGAVREDELTGYWIRGTVNNTAIGEKEDSSDNVGLCLCKSAGGGKVRKIVVWGKGEIEGIRKRLA
jgi:hypothetical protein